MRYRFKGTLRTTGRKVEGHAHGDTPEIALKALSEHGITADSLREDPEPLNLAAQTQPLSSAIDSALDTAASQIPFDAIVDRYKGKQIWVLDRDKIRTRVAQVVDQAISDATKGISVSTGLNVQDLRQQVSDAIGGLFKDNRNLTSQVSDTSMKLEHQIRRIEQMVHRQESVLAQMTIAISRIGSGGGGAFAGPRRHAYAAGAGREQNAVLLEIFKENLRLRGIEIDEQPAGAPESEQMPGPEMADVLPKPSNGDPKSIIPPSPPPGGDAKKPDNRPEKH